MQRTFRLASASNACSQSRGSVTGESTLGEYNEAETYQTQMRTNRTLKMLCKPDLSSISTSSALLSLQGPGSYHEPLNFAGALIYFGDAGIAISSLDGILAAISVAAMNLNGFVRHARCHFAGEKFCDGRFHRKSRARLLLPCRAPREQTCSVNFRGHVREHELYRLKLCDGMAEGLALLRIRKRRFERALRDPSACEAIPMRPPSSMESAIL